MSIFGLVKFLTSTLSAFIVDEIGRRSLFISGTIGIILSLLAIYISNLYHLDLFRSILFYVYIATFEFSMGPITWIVVPETLPERGITLALLSHWFFSFILVLSFPYLVNNVFSNNN